MRFSHLTLILTLVFAPLAVASADEYAFTVDLGKRVKEREVCRPFKSLQNKSSSGEPFTKWCSPNGAAVFICRGFETFYIIKFPDLRSCEVVLSVMKAHLGD